MENRILVVDDDAQNLMIVQSALKHEYTIKTCLNGQEALDTLFDFLPDVILLDWTMPVLDGMQTLTAIKANNSTKHILVIMMTGLRTDQNALLQAFNGGAIDFIRKPFDLLELRARVNSVVQLSQAYRLEIEIKNRELVTYAIRLAETNKVISDLFRQIEMLAENDSNVNRIIEKISFFKQQFFFSLSDNRWNQFNENFQRVHPRFHLNLLQRHPGLTPAEIQLSTLIKLGLSTKEVSAITHSTADSIKVARARLRKKLNVDPETNLTSYLLSF